MTKADTILTMDKRNDGWDDVRNLLVEMKEDRQEALEQLKTSITSAPAIRWTQVGKVRLFCNGLQVSDLCFVAGACR